MMSIDLIWFCARSLAGKCLIFGLLSFAATPIFAEGPSDFQSPGRTISIDVVRNVNGVEKRLNIQNVPYIIRGDVVSVIMDGDRDGWVCAMAFLPTNDGDIKDEYIIAGVPNNDGIFNFTAPNLGNIGLVPVIMLAKKKNNNWLRDFQDAVKKKHTEFIKSAANFQAFGQATTFIEQAADYMASLKNNPDGTANTQLTNILNAFAADNQSGAVNECYDKSTRQERRSCIFPLVINSLINPSNGAIGTSKTVFRILAQLIPNNYLMIIQGGVALTRFIIRLFDKGYQFQSALGTAIFDGNNNRRIQLKLKETPENDIDKKPTVQVYVLPSSYGQSNEIAIPVFTNNNTSFCSSELETKMAIPAADAAKLIAGKDLVHDWEMRFDGGAPFPVELSGDGKFTVKRDAPPVNLPKNSISNATIEGWWGFRQFFVGGKVKVVALRDASAYELLNNNKTGFLELGKTETVTLRLKDGSVLPLCVDKSNASLTNAEGFPTRSAATSKELLNQSLEFTFDLNNFAVSAGPGVLTIKQFGSDELLKVDTPKFGRPRPTFTAAEYRIGDNSVVINGTGLAGVDGVTLKQLGKSISFAPVDGSLKAVGTAEERKYSTTDSIAGLMVDREFTSEVMLSDGRGVANGPSGVVKSGRPVIRQPEIEIVESAENTIIPEDGAIRMADRISLTIKMAENSSFPFSPDSKLQIRLKTKAGTNPADAEINFSGSNKASFDIQPDGKSVIITFIAADIIPAAYAAGNFEFSIKQGDLPSNWEPLKDNPLFVRVPWNMKVGCPTAQETRYSLTADGLPSIGSVTLSAPKTLAKRASDGNSFLVALPPAPVPVEGQPIAERVLTFLVKLRGHPSPKPYTIDLKIPVCSQ